MDYSTEQEFKRIWGTINILKNYTCCCTKTCLGIDPITGSSSLFLNQEGNFIAVAGSGDIQPLTQILYGTGSGVTSDNLFVRDSITGNVGIGINNPQATLDVFGGLNVINNTNTPHVIGVISGTTASEVQWNNIDGQGTTGVSIIYNPNFNNPPISFILVGDNTANTGNNKSAFISSSDGVSTGSSIEVADSVINLNSSGASPNTNIVSINDHATSFKDINLANVVVIDTQAKTLQYIDGNQAVNKILTSDASGIATWQKSIATGATGSEPSSPYLGQFYFDTTLVKMKFWNGTVWAIITSTP